VPEPGPGDSPDRTEAGLTGVGIPEPVNGSGGSPTRVGRQRPCPNCGSRSVAAIAYGLPSPSVWQDPDLDTEFVLGGCCIWPEMPMFRCHECGHEWAPPEDSRRTPGTTSRRPKHGVHPRTE
jgi:hypothetical protein